MSSLFDSLRAELAISSSFDVSYRHPDYKQFFALKGVHEIPSKVPMLRINLKPEDWWNMPSTTGSWIPKGNYDTFEVKSNGKIFHGGLHKRFTDFAANMNFDHMGVKRIVAISNRSLVGNFEGHRSTVKFRHSESPELFKKETWKTMKGTRDQRQIFMTHYNNYAARFPPSKETGSPQVIPMIQGTSEVAAWKICGQGFGIVASTDKGYYGQGVYFTSQVQYAAKYTPSAKVFIMAAVIPGNVFPVVEDPRQASSPWQARDSGLSVTLHHRLVR